MNYYRVFLGAGHAHTPECLSGSFIGVDYSIREDLSNYLSNDYAEFKERFVPIMRQQRPDLKPVGAGLKCSALWKLCKGINDGDIVLCRDAEGTYHVGEVLGGYHYAPDGHLPHRRSVRWLSVSIPRSTMSIELQNGCGGPLTLIEVSHYRSEIEQLMGGNQAHALPIQTLNATESEIIDPVAFALEEHLEEFLVKNWYQIELSKDFVILEEEGEQVGQQFPTEAGKIDILAVSRDNKKLLVIELKRGRATDVVVGQTLRYMGFVKNQIATPDQIVEGVIIALEDDQKLRWALSAVKGIAFYRYEVSFKLNKA